MAYAFRLVPALQSARPSGRSASEIRLSRRSALRLVGKATEIEKGQRPVAKGTVRWFSEEKGYGFISPDGGEEEIFVHYTDVEGEGFRSLREGERVRYEAAASTRYARRREEAKDVRRVG
jgi:cold shock protein